MHSFKIYATQNDCAVKSFTLVLSLSFFILFFSPCLNAQTTDQIWFGEGKSWHVSYEGWDATGCEKWTVNGSENVAGIDAHRIEATGWKYQLPFSHLDTNTFQIPAYGYTSGDSVFLYTQDFSNWASGAWYLAYDMGMQPGDTISYQYDFDWAGLTHLELALDSLDEIALNDSISRKWMHFNIWYQEDSIPLLLGDAAVIEGIGMSCISRALSDEFGDPPPFSYPCREKSFPVNSSTDLVWSFPDPRYALVSYIFLDPSEAIAFRYTNCYEDGQVSINTVPNGESCCAIPPQYLDASDLPPDLQLFRLSPNPATGISVLEYQFEPSASEDRFLLLNATGQILNTHQANASKGFWEISLQHLPKGTYFVVWQREGQIRYGKTLLVE